MQLKPFSVAIFDMDGTVLDSMPIWDHLADHFLLKQGRTPKPELREALRALNMKATAEYLKEQYALLQTGEEIAHALNVLAAEEYAKKAGLKPGIIAYLTALQKKRSQDGYCNGYRSDDRSANFATSRTDEIFLTRCLPVPKKE